MWCKTHGQVVIRQDLLRRKNDNTYYDGTYKNIFENKLVCKSQENSYIGDIKKTIQIIVYFIFQKVTELKPISRLSYDERGPYTIRNHL